MKHLMQAAGGRKNGSESTFIFSYKAVLAGWVTIASIAFTMGGFFFNAKKLPEAVSGLKVDMAVVKSDIKNLTRTVTEIQKYLLSKK